MILKALYDYYDRCGNLPTEGTEEQEIEFVIVLSTQGQFLRFEDLRSEDKKRGTKYIVTKSVGRSSGILPNYLYDNVKYVLGFTDSTKETDIQKAPRCLQSFIDNLPDNAIVQPLKTFYTNTDIIEIVSKDPLWEEVKKAKKYISFRIEGDTEIVAQKEELFPIYNEEGNDNMSICLITGKRCHPVVLTTPTPIVGGKSTGKIVAFQVNSGYDSYGKTQVYNAPISQEAEFKYSTALKTLLARESHNKFTIGNRTFLFWTSKRDETSIALEESFYEFFGFQTPQTNNPNTNVNNVKKVFLSIYSGELKVSVDNTFYILGLAPNAARIAIVYWAEIPLKDFATHILQHFRDTEIVNKEKSMGMYTMLSVVTLKGKDFTPNLPEAVAKSIFQESPYPFALYSECIRRIRAEQNVTSNRCAIIKAYLNRINDKKITVMLDKENNNVGYLCGRLFAILDNIQDRANNVSSIRERYMNAASTTPSAVFATILNLSMHHAEKLTEGNKIFFEKLKQEIMDKIPAEGFPTHLDLQDQGRFFVGYYHQRQELFTKKEE